MPSLPRPISSPDRPSLRSVVKACKEFAILWLSLNWLDLACMAILGGLTYAIYLSPVAPTRTFPITFTQSGDIIYPEWAYPYRGWILASWQAGLMSIGVPIFIYVVAQVRIKSPWDASAAILGTLWAIILASVVQVVVKQLIGGFRPYFLDVCMPDISLASSRNATGLNGVGFQKVMYTTEICTQPDRWMIKNAVTSFPSGHATAAFAGFGFLFLWLNAKLKVWADHRPAFGKLAFTMLPLLSALMIACSLTIDAAHNWYDIVAGSIIGAIMALAAYRASYAAVWDWRFNHLHLQPQEAFPFQEKEGDVDYLAHTITRSVGWGSAGKQWLGDNVDRATSTAASGHSSGSRHGDPQPAPSSRPRANKRSSTAEEIV